MPFVRFSSKSPVTVFHISWYISRIMLVLKAQIFVLQCQDTYGWIMLLSSNPLYANVMLHSVILWGFSNLCLNVKWSSRRQRFSLRALNLSSCFLRHHCFSGLNFKQFYRFLCTPHFCRPKKPYLLLRFYFAWIGIQTFYFYWFMLENSAFRNIVKQRFATVAATACSSDIFLSFLSLTSPSRPQCQTQGLLDKYSSNTALLYSVCTNLLKILLKLDIECTTWIKELIVKYISVRYRS